MTATPGGLRHVESGDGFDEDLARFFASEDGPEGHPPSWMTFLDQDLERILRVFRYELDSLLPAGSDRREAVIACTTIWAVLVTGRVRVDGVVELYGLEPDLRPFAG